MYIAMSFSTRLLGLRESYDYSSSFDDDFPKDTSGFSEEVEFGVDKLSRPSSEGLSAGMAAMNRFANATDEAQDVDINLSFYDSFPKDNSGFGKDADSEGLEEEAIDTNTIPAHNCEYDQFEEEDGYDSYSDISTEELATDDDDILGESASVDWDDLY